MEESTSHGSNGILNSLPSYKQKEKINYSEDVEYDTAISQTGLGKYTVLVLIMMVPAVWCSGFDTSALSMVLPIAGCELHLTSLEKGWLHSAVYIGMISSGFLWGFLSDEYGRQKLLTCGYILDGFSCLGSGLTSSFWTLFFFKFLSGFMICGPYSILMAYISEIFGRKKRDIILLLFGVNFTVGSIVQPALGLLIIPWSSHWNLMGLLDLYSWRIYLMVCAFPQFLAGILAFFCVESPKFLLDKGRPSEALDALRRIYAINSGLPPDSYPVKSLKLSEACLKNLMDEQSKETKSLKSLACEFVSQLKSLFSRIYIWKTLFAFVTLTGSAAVMNAIRLLLPEIFSHFSSDDNVDIAGTQLACFILMQTVNNTIACDQVVVNSGIYLNMMIIFAFCFICQIISNIIARFFKIIYIIVLSAAIPGICSILIPHFSAEFVVYLSAIFMSLLLINFYFTISAIVLMFPTSLRATSVSISMMVSRFGVLFGNLFLAWQIYTNCDFAFYFSGSVLLIVAIISSFLPGPDKTEVFDEKPSNQTKKKNTEP